MIKRLLIGLVLLLGTGMYMHAQNWVWAQRLGNVKSDKVTCIKTDGQGYIYIAGYFSTNTPIGTNGLMLNFTANANSKEAFIAKLDSTGYCYWAKSGGQYFDDRVLGMDVDSAGNSTITGTFWEGAGINFPPINVTGSAWGSNDQCFIVRFNTNGNPVWGNFVCGDNVTPSGGNYRDDQGLDVAMDKHGNSYVVGFMTTVTLYCGGNTVTATNPNTGTHKHCYWLAKINSNGVFQWARTFGRLPWDAAANKYIERDIAVAVDETNGVYITGGFDGTAQFGTNSFTSGGGYDIFAMKYDTSGNFIWSTQGGSNKDDWSNGICSDKNGSIYITGEHRDSLIMDTILVKNYDGRDVFVIKMDAATGKPIWGKRAGSVLGSERGNDIWADDHCNVYVVGDINEGAKFGDNIIIPSNGDSIQGFVAKISPEGKWTWVATGGGQDNNDRCNAVAKGKGAQLYAAGYFRSSAVYGNSGLTSVGSSDGFFARLHDSLLNLSSTFQFPTPTKTTLCYGDTMIYKIDDHNNLIVNPPTGVTYNSDSTKLTFGPLSTTTYTLTGYGTGDCPEYDTISFTLFVGNETFAFNTPGDTVICPGESVTFPINPHDFLQITPSAGATLNANESLITFAPSSTTTYTLTGYKLGVCPMYDTLVMTIVLAPLPGADFDITPNPILIQDPTFHFVNKTPGNHNYFWYKGNSLFSTSTNPTYQESSEGTYCYKLVAESLYGCKDSVTQCGRIISDEQVLFPNAFTPNGDGLNDDFNPTFINIDRDAMTDYSFKVVNRYGQMVYETNNPYFGWDGSFKGNKCDIGTYYYLCSFKTKQNKPYERKGDVTLLR